MQYSRGIMDRDRMRKDPAHEGIHALEPILAWYAAYKASRRHRPDAANVMAAARQWLWDRLNHALDLEDELDPVTSNQSERRR